MSLNLESESNANLGNTTNQGFQKPTIEQVRAEMESRFERDRRAKFLESIEPKPQEGEANVPTN